MNTCDQYQKGFGCNKCVVLTMIPPIDFCDYHHKPINELWGVCPYCLADPEEVKYAYLMR